MLSEIIMQSKARLPNKAQILQRVPLRKESSESITAKNKTKTHCSSFLSERRIALHTMDHPVVQISITAARFKVIKRHPFPSKV